MSLAALRMAERQVRRRQARNGADRRNPLPMPNPEGGVGRELYSASLRNNRLWLPRAIPEFLYHTGMSLAEAEALVQRYESSPITGQA